MLSFLLGVTHVWFSKTDRQGTPQRVTWIAGIASAFLATDAQNTLPPWLGDAARRP